MYSFVMLSAMCIYFSSCNTNNESYNTNSSDSASTGQLRDNDSYGLKIDNFSIPDVLKNVPVEEIRAELIYRSEFLNKRDSINRLSLPDTIKPSENHFFDNISNYDLVATYQMKLKERKVIYGRDNRHNISEITDSKIQKQARTVAALIPSDQLFRKADGTYRLKTMGSYSSYYELCSTERFFNEPVCASCTAFAIAENLMATAGHCLHANDFRKYYFVFDLNLENIGEFIANGIPDSLVYQPVDTLIIHEASADYSVVKTNKPIPYYRIAKIADKDVNNDSHFYVLGYPCGLPLKYTNESSLRINNSSDYFVLDCDTYGGNSGSPVFDAITNEVEGILVRGNDDFKIPIGQNCNSSIVCGQHDCRGEEATKISFLKKYINAN